MLTLLLNDFPLHVFDLFIDTLACHCLSLDLVYYVLDLKLLSISSLLCNILHFLLFGHKSLMHLKFFEQFIILALQIVNLFLLLAELGLQRIIESLHVIFYLAILAHFIWVLSWPLFNIFIVLIYSRHCFLLLENVLTAFFKLSEKLFLLKDY